MQIKVPKLPKSTEKAILSVWHKYQDDIVYENETVAEIKIDKATIIVRAMVSGTIGDIFFSKNDAVLEGDTLGTIISTQNNVDISEVTDEVDSLNELEQEIDALMNKIAIEPQKSNLNYKVSDDYLSLKNIDFSLDDLEKTAVFDDKDLDQSVIKALRNTKQTPSKQLVIHSEKTVLSETVIEQLNMLPIMDFRYKFATEFYKKYRVKLGLTGFFVKACAIALKNFPIVNSVIKNEDIVYHNYCDIKIIDDKNITVLRNAELMSFAKIEHQIESSKSSLKSRQTEHKTNASFTIINNNKINTLLSTTSLSTNQNAALNIHKIQDCPVVIDGRIAVRPMSYLSLSYNAKFISHKTATLFLHTIKQNLKDLTRLLLNP